ncbi:hypothetical protein BRC65_08090 [Halobacteriales archaeon QH_2_65_14]|nr:MAG: hypothetical protein BRC65_08090 [Halobacteriales archaeon QH_2_65_14]
MTPLTQLLLQSGEAGSQSSETTVFDIDEESVGPVFDALSSETARSILGLLYDEHLTASEIAEEVDTSQQNVNHHLSQLEECGLVEVVGTEYSDQGVEMDVYGPTNDRLVLQAGEEADPWPEPPDPPEGGESLAGAVAVGALLGIVVDRLVRRIRG